MISQALKSYMIALFHCWHTVTLNKEYNGHNRLDIWLNMGPSSNKFSNNNILAKPIFSKGDLHTI